jgi:hypothetical protein
MRWFWVLAVIVALILPIAANAQQSMFFEGDFSVIISRNSIVISGDNDLSLQEIGLSDNAILKAFSIGGALNPDLRVRYTCILPFQDSGNGQLTKQITLNGIVYGPKDANSTQNRDIFTQYRFCDNRIEIDFLPFIKQQNTQVYFVGSVEFALAGLSLKGKPSTSGNVGGTSTQSNDPIETSVSANKTLVGIGVGGFQRQNNILVRYKVVYDFLNQGRGWLAEANMRYEVQKHGFVEAGYFYEDLNMPLDVMRLKNRFQGALFRVGLLF